MTPQQIEFLKTLEPAPSHWGGLGALSYHYDPRDWDVRSLPGVSDVLEAGVPDSVDLTSLLKGEILNQGGTGACVAFSSSHVAAMDDVIETGQWATINAPLVYSRAGGTGQNGVDSRLVLQQAVEQGMPLVSGGAVKTIASYAFVPQQPGVFTRTIEAALAAGYPMVLALLLPSDFGWESGHTAVTSGYHQIGAIGYYTNSATGMRYWRIVNSWGPSWPGNSPHPGVGSILQSYCEANAFQNNYCFAYVVTGIVTPNPIPIPTPTPTPAPVPARAATVTGRAVAGPTNGIWPNVGATLPFGQDVTLTVNTIQFDGMPTPTPDPQPNPNPQPNPQPNPGGLTVTVPTKRYSASMVGIWAYSSANGQPVSARFTGTANQVILEPRTGSPAVWILRGAQATGPISITINATADDGRTGTGTASV